MLTKPSLLGSERVKTSFTSPDKIIGLVFRLCGAIGVITNNFCSGVTIGPPAESEYAVEPVGVEIITPSPLNFPKNLSST